MAKQFATNTNERIGWTKWDMKREPKVGQQKQNVARVE